MTDFYYAKAKDGDLFRFNVEQDEYYDEDILTEWDGWVGTFNLYWNRYSLGHNKGKDDADETLRELVEKYVPEWKVTSAALAGLLSCKYALNLDAEDDDERYKEMWWHTPWEGEPELHEYTIGKREFYDRVLEQLEREEMMRLLTEENDFVILPCYIYEHSGLSISCSSYKDPWDSGNAGYIYTTRERCKELGVDFNKAKEILIDEVKIYDQYLQGEVYIIDADKYDFDMEDWDDYENCGGFFSDKWGEELVKEMADGYVDEDDFISEEEMENEIEARLAEYKVMEQAEYAVAI